MNQDIAHADDSPPRNIRRERADFVGNVPSRLAEQFEVAQRVVYAVMRSQQACMSAT